MQTEDLDTVIWKPPLRVINLKDVYDRDFLYESTGYGFINGCSGKVGVHGSVRYAVSCRFDFAPYPFDEHKCDLNFYSPSFEDMGVPVREEFACPTNIVTIRATPTATPQVIIM